LERKRRHEGLGGREGEPPERTGDGRGERNPGLGKRGKNPSDGKDAENADLGQAQGKTSGADPGLAGGATGPRARPIDTLKHSLGKSMPRGKKPKRMSVSKHIGYRSGMGHKKRLRMRARRRGGGPAEIGSPIGKIEVPRRSF